MYLFISRPRIIEFGYFYECDKISPSVQIILYNVIVDTELEKVNYFRAIHWDQLDNYQQ